MRFFIADAFTDKIFGGNPAGVVLVKQFPDEETMVNTAAELRYSETAFVRQTGDTDFHIRYFTPVDEVDLCGHATIASFSVLADAGIIPAKASCRLKTLAGDLNVEVADGQVLMEMGKPVFLTAIETPEALKDLYRIMGAGETPLPVTAIRGGREIALFPELVSTGLPDIILPMPGVDALSAMKPDFPALARLSRQYEAVGVHAFAFGEEGIQCRNFAPLYGIDEEAATGTANGALTYYLYRKGLITPGKDTVYTQGVAMGRPSRILSRLSLKGEEPVIRIGGGSAILAQGEIYV